MEACVEEKSRFLLDDCDAVAELVVTVCAMALSGKFCAKSNKPAHSQAPAFERYFLFSMVWCRRKCMVNHRTLRLF